MIHKKSSLLIGTIALACYTSAQKLQVLPIIATAGEQTEIVIHADDLGTGVTALQFNLTLPEGITLDEAAITKGTAVSRHELSVSTLSSGERLFVLYHMNLDAIGNGELLRLPVTIGDDATSGNAALSKVRFATPEAVSIAAADADGLVTAIQHVQADDKAQAGKAHEATYTLDGRRTTTKPAQRGLYIRGSKKVAVK